MFAAAAFCPHPPLLIPACAPGADLELDALRTACDTAVRTLVAQRPDRIVCVGDAPERVQAPTGTTGSMESYGVDVRAGSGDGPPSLPLSLIVAAFLLDRAGWAGERSYVGIPDAHEPAACTALGESLVEPTDRVGFLVMGDGSAYDAVAAPGPLESAAVAYDELVAKALATADVAALLEQSAGQARELYAAGRAAQQVAAGALRSAPADSNPVEATLLYAGAPRGVAYAVATWVAGS